MSAPLRLVHGSFGRVALLRLDRSMVVHAHRVAHVIFKEGGIPIEFGVRDREYLLSEQNVLLVNAWEPHFYRHRAHREEPTVLLALYLEPTWLKRLDPRLGRSANPHFFRQPSRPLEGRLDQLHSDLVEALIERDNARLHTIEFLISEVMGELLWAPRSFIDLRATFDSRAGLTYDSRIRRAIERIKDGNGVNIDFGRLAGEVGMSRPHFFHVFGRQAGMTPGTFADMIKMDASIQRIAYTERSFQDIAVELGFDAQGNFTRFFSQHQGASPSLYRRIVQILA